MHAFENSFGKSLTMPLHLISIDNSECIQMGNCRALAIGRGLTVDVSKT